MLQDVVYTAQIHSFTSRFSPERAIAATVEL